MTIDNVSGGELIDPAWGNAVADAINGMGLVTSYTPTLKQGAATPNIAKTVTYCKWGYIGPTTAMMHFKVAATGTGTVGQPVELSLPVSRVADSIDGSGVYYDSAGTTNYFGRHADGTTTDYFVLIPDRGGGAWGVSPNHTVISGNVWAGHVIWEVA